MRRRALQHEIEPFLETARLISATLRYFLVEAEDRLISLVFLWREPRLLIGLWFGCS